MRISVLFLAIFLMSATVYGDEVKAVSSFSAADALFLQRTNHGNAREALRQYRVIYSTSPDVESAWRVSMACYFVAFNVVKDNATKKKLYAEGRDAGLYAVAHSSGSAAGHFWTAVNMALYGETVGVLKMLFTLGTVRQHLEASAALDPSYAYGGAYRILGKIDESLPSVLGGDRDRALAYYRRAIALVPDEPVNYLFLARLLAKQYNDRAGARAVLQQGLALPPPDMTRYESLKGMEELKEFAKTKTPD